MMKQMYEMNIKQDWKGYSNYIKLHSNSIQYKLNK